MATGATAPVTTAHRSPLVRRYLLGDATDEECEALERDYFENETALGLVESEEEALIEEYLAGRLNARERDFFERRYLASPAHRQRGSGPVGTRRAVPARRDEAVARLVAKHAAKMRRHADRSCDVGAELERHHAGRQGRSRAT